MGYSPRVFLVLFVLGGTEAALVVMSPLLGASVAVLIAGALVLAYLLVSTLDGSVEPTLLTWVFAFPLGYYFFSFPREKSIITLDRAVMAVLVLAMARAASQNSECV